MRFFVAANHLMMFVVAVKFLRQLKEIGANMMRLQTLRCLLNSLAILAELADKRTVFIVHNLRKYRCLCAFFENTPRPSMSVLQITSGVTRQTDRFVDVEHYVAADFDFQELVAQRARHDFLGSIAAVRRDCLGKFIKQPLNRHHFASARAHFAGTQFHQTGRVIE